MSLRAVVLAILVLVLITTPQIRGSGICPSTEPPAGAESPAHHPSTPSTDCGSNSPPSFAAHCTGCGVALLVDGLFLGEEAFWSYWSPLKPVAFLGQPPPHWRPPA